MSGLGELDKLKLYFSKLGEKASHFKTHWLKSMFSSKQL